MNKKILAILMALLMIVVSGVAMAEETESTATISKTYEGTGKPAATFTFSITADEGQGENVPDVTVANGGQISISAENTTGEVTFNIPSVGESGYPEKPGTYTYTIKETAGNIAGIGYDEQTYKLTVTVYNDGGDADHPVWKTAISIKDDTDKKEKAAFTNTYSAPGQDAENGTLLVTKKLAGMSADLSDTFTITVQFTAEDGKVLASTAGYVASEGVNVTAGNDNMYTITGIGHDGNVKFYNIPYHTAYSVTEVVNEEYKVVGQSNTVYTVTYDGCTGRLDAAAQSQATVTNTSNIAPDTGVTTDSLPYIMLMAIVAIAAVAFVMKKRAAHE